jgi:hypothetical protein
MPLTAKPPGRLPRHHPLRKAPLHRRARLVRIEDRGRDAALEAVRDAVAEVVVDVVLVP